MVARYIIFFADRKILVMIIQSIIEDTVYFIFFIILEIKESFHKIDLNGDGRLSRRELMKAAAVLGMNPTDKDIDAMMKDVDKNSTWKLQLFSRE